MRFTSLTRVRRATVGAALVVLTCMIGFALPLRGQAVTVRPVLLRLGTTPAGQLTVLDANVEEYLSVRDNRDHHDLNNFARRVARVFGAKRAGGVAVHAPDLVFLQEVDMATARVVRSRLSRALHQPYVIAGLHGVGPAHGRGAIIRGRTRHHALLTRATAVLYNHRTMRRPSSAHLISFPYPHRQAWTVRACRHAHVECQAGMWESRQSAIMRIVSKKSGRAYAVASVHFVPSPFIRPRLSRHQYAGFREARWFRRLVLRLHHYYPHAHAILAGDFNYHVCRYQLHRLGSPACDSPHEYTPLYRTALHYHYRDAIGLGIDHIFTRDPIRVAGRDHSYKLFTRHGTRAGRVVDPPRTEYLTRRDFRLRFGSSRSFDRCESLYSVGAGLSRRARSISGCSRRFYSDHPFDWAVIR